MTANEVRKHAREGIEKLNPIIRNAGNMVATAYQLGFDVGLELGEKICREICKQHGIDPDQYLSVKDAEENLPNSALLG